MDRLITSFQPGDFVVAKFFRYQIHHYTLEENMDRVRTLVETGLSPEDAVRVLNEKDFLVHPGHMGRVTSSVALFEGIRHRVRWFHDGKLRQMYGTHIRLASPLEVLARQEAVWSREPT